jgi:hypothetical protein
VSGLAAARVPGAVRSRPVESMARANENRRAFGQSNQAIQAKLRVGPVDDPLEREADRVADAVVGGGSVASLAHAHGAVQRKCAACAANEDIIQRKCEECAEEEEKEETVRRAVDGPTQTASAGGAETAAAAVASGGAPLSADSRAYFEPRFGRDLSDVRIHADAAAAHAAQAIDARAYTLGNHIAFAPGEHAPSGREGAHLLAHELAHVVQQESGLTRAIRRAPTATSRCPANTHGSPADPMAAITEADARAQLMALGSSHLLFVEALTRDDATLGGPSAVSAAYLRRFGHPPAASRGRFRNRFDSRLHATENEAIRAEMLFLSRRFETLHTFIAGPIRYRCPGTSVFTLPGCAAGRCGADEIGSSCPGGRQIAACPLFWTDPTMTNADQRGANIIHEAVHMRLRFRPHGTATVEGRGRNPECYAAFVADVYGFVSNDQTDCAALP